MTRPGTERAGGVARIGELAAVEREAAAPDAFGEAQLPAFELGDAGVDPVAPVTGELLPLGAARRPVGRQLGELPADFVEGQPNPLREDDERDPPQHRPRVSPMARTGPLRAD